MTTTGAITSAWVDASPPPPAMSEEEGVETLIGGASAGYYTLPPALRKAADGAAALLRAYEELEATRRARFSAGWDAELINLAAAKVRDAATSSGAIPKGDIAAEVGRARAEEAALRDLSRILEIAARGAASYPAFHARASAEEIAASLDAALAALVAAAAPHSARLAAVDPEAGDPLVTAYRADPKGYDALALLLPRLAALEAAGQAMTRLGTPWQALPADDGTPLTLRLAHLAAEPSETP